MNIADLKRVLVSFADSAADVEISKGKITAIIRGDMIDAEIIEKEGELLIREDGSEMKILLWISIRIAQLQQLAARIKDSTVDVDDFIYPNGKLLDDVENDPSETEEYIRDIYGCLQEKLGNRIVGTTSVMYLTSDAGEGKTTLINHLAIKQATLFQQKKTNWLLVPIPLGGRPFLRFDDIVIASLVNRLRFRLFYFDSFIELIKLGLIVPAFDGFEEMFMENSGGEALSATGQLMSKLESHGNVLIAARNAYFDYKSFSSQAKLFDTIGGHSVAFSKSLISRWSKDQFIEYATARKVHDAENLYDSIVDVLGNPSHPLLVRPVLVNRLLDVIQSGSDIKSILESLSNTSDYFPNFVNVIIEREAHTKWIDTSGEPYKPLLTVEQHYDILSIIAEEMWLNSTDSLPLSILDLLADMYSESAGFGVRISRQIKERLKQHALLVRSDQNSEHIKFDHEEFQEFFLGISFFNSLSANKISDFKNLMRRGLIDGQTVDAILAYCKNKNVQSSFFVDILDKIQISEGPTSFVKENCGTLMMKFMSKLDKRDLTLSNYVFPSDCMQGVTLTNINFKNSYFQSTAISTAIIKGCVFIECTFDALEIGHENVEINHSKLIDCEFASIQNVNKDSSFYDPFNIRKELEEIGFEYEICDESLEPEPLAEVSVEEDLKIVERALRRFIRGSQINDNVFRIRLGNNAEYFIHSLLPLLIEGNIIEELDYSGAGNKRRFKLAIPFDKVNFALQNSEGTLSGFLRMASSS